MSAMNGNGAGQEGFGSRVDQVTRDAQTLVDDARTVVNDLQGRIDLRGRVERNPYGTLLAAAGLGYILGGGLFTPLTASIVRLGVKLAALPFVKDELLAMAHGAVDGFVASAREREGSNSPVSVTPPGQGNVTGSGV